MVIVKFLYKVETKEFVKVPLVTTYILFTNLHNCNLIWIDKQNRYVAKDKPLKTFKAFFARIKNNFDLIALFIVYLYSTYILVGSNHYDYCWVWRYGTRNYNRKISR